MNKKRASIQFTSLTKLWEFRMVIKVNVFEINMKDITITCQCTQEDIDLALQLQRESSSYHKRRGVIGFEAACSGL